MDATELERASARERDLYRELLAAYGALRAVTEDGAMLDCTAIATAHTRAEAAATGLRQVALLLAPHRLGGEPVPPDVQMVWRESAALAAEAAGTNAALVNRVRARQRDIRARLTTLSGGRRALAAYRPRAERRAGSLSSA